MHLSTLLLLAGGVAALLPGHRAAVSHTFDADRAASCLAEARSLLDAHEEFFLDARDWLDGDDVALPSVDTFALQRSPFAEFEGAWCGSWDGTPVRHVWRSIDSDAQLVFVEDDGAPHEGINLRGEDGAICGIVRDAAGRERLHEGWLAHGHAAGPASIEWLTPDRAYLERVVRTSDGPRYHIDEVVLGRRARRGVSATYAPCDRGAQSPAHEATEGRGSGTVSQAEPDMVLENPPSVVMARPVA